MSALTERQCQHTGDMGFYSKPCRTVKYYRLCCVYELRFLGTNDYSVVQASSFRLIGLWEITVMLVVTMLGRSAKIAQI